MTATMSDNEAALPKCARRPLRRLLEMNIISIRADYKFCRERRSLDAIPLPLLQVANPITFILIESRI